MILRSVNPASCGTIEFSHGGGGAGGSWRQRSAATRVSIGESRGRQGGLFRCGANLSRAGTGTVQTVRHWELLVSTNWREVDIGELRALLTGTQQNCDQFPERNPDGSVRTEVSPVKLKRAIQHSFIVVAMYIRGDLGELDYFPERLLTPPDRNRRTLVAFARATSDRSLTAAIHDVAVAPSLQGRGVGRRLMQRMVREISRYGIADISVMADRHTRPFFGKCGFDSDVLGSTAMMYTACTSSSELLLPPPPAVQEARRKQVVNSVSSA